MNTLNNEVREVLLRNGYLCVEDYHNFCAIDLKLNQRLVGTLVANMATYGYAPSVEALRTLSMLAPHELKSFWSDYEPIFKRVTGADRKMEKFVVYKNFPSEVLEMSEAQYWINQILMYIGAPNEWFTSEEVERPAMLENLDLKILALTKEDSVKVLTRTLIAMPNRWSDNQTAAAKTLYDFQKFFISVDEFAFKENGIVLAVHAIKEHNSVDFDMSNATDVLRLCAGLSDGDISLRKKVRFTKMKRPLRKKMLRLLNSTKNLKEDFSIRQEEWKRLLSLLHPGDYPQFKHVTAAYDTLYNDSYFSFNKIVDAQYPYPSETILMELQRRPGEFMRRLHASYAKFGAEAVEAFCDVVPQLSTSQLIKLRKYLQRINSRKTLIVPPKGNWSRAVILENKKKEIESADLEELNTAVSEEISARLNSMFPEGVQLDDRLAAVKLQTNDQKLAEYGRGTTFDIPENIKFLRSASYWKCARAGNVWFDNGWNFFNSQWKSVGVCSWDNNHKVGGAVFSGDPTNSKDMEGRACQMIDLYIDALLAQGIRYAVWSVLGYSNIPFSKAEDVLATLQMGEDAEAGKLYEPARAQMVFPLTGDSVTKYVAYVDLRKRKLFYMDVDFGASVTTAARNGRSLESKMPAYVEYLKSIPSVYELFSHAKPGSTPILYDDSEVDITSGKAYVFKPLNAENSFTQISLSSVL